MAYSYSRLGNPQQSYAKPHVGASKRFVATLILVSALLSVFFIGWFRNHRPADTFDATLDLYDQPEYPGDSSQSRPVDVAHFLPGPAIAPKLGNETAKAELGRAAWKLFHTMMARFPEKPTSVESESLRTYIHLFQRLYPCGECSNHFAAILEDFPPQVSSRNAAAGWACHVHNQVNKSLKKDIFDCSNIGDFYDCGCAEDEAEESAASSAVATPGVE